MEQNKHTITQKILRIDQLEENTGQLIGLPENPRYITDDKMMKLKANLEEYPGLLELRAILVYPMEEDKYIVIGGNMRLRALREMGKEEAPCIIIDPDTPIEKLKTMTVLDNSSFGKFDMDSLANMWDDAKLDSFGVDIPSFDDESLDGLFSSESGKKESDTVSAEKIIITLPEELEDDKDEILEFVTDILNDRFDGCSAAFKPTKD